jgi:hypothetical protein
LAKVWKDAGKREADLGELQGRIDALLKDVKELEGDVDGLKEEVAGKYLEGFGAALAQVKVLFPNLDEDVLLQASFLKKVEDGKLVSL